jgi:hypothetical protein
VGDLLGQWCVNMPKHPLQARTPHSPTQQPSSLATTVTQPPPPNSHVLTSTLPCTHCHAILPSYANFCGVCGAKLEKPLPPVHTTA